ncbi:MAG TPA: GFA family protein [Chthoniobacterales bacterium]|jgi:hypothetical protein|nr:GFA family protein [Chthoniobacterales bacterium]
MAGPTIEGGCLCGAVRYEAGGEPYHVTHCHCEDCRRSAGTAFVTWASFRRENFRLTRGAMRQVAFAGRLRSFCPKCGTSLAFQASPESDEIDLTVASFDHPESVTPADHIWTADRLPWIKLADGLPAHAQNRV